MTPITFDIGILLSGILPGWFSDLFLDCSHVSFRTSKIDKFI